MGRNGFIFAELVELPCETGLASLRILIVVADPAAPVSAVDLAKDSGFGEPLVERPVRSAADGDPVQEALSPRFQWQRGVRQATGLDNTALDSAMDDSFGAMTPLSPIHAYPLYGKARAKRAIRRSVG